jgi:hypothetical protein
MLFLYIVLSYMLFLYIVLNERDWIASTICPVWCLISQMVSWPGRVGCKLVELNLKAFCCSEESYFLAGRGPSWELGDQNSHLNSGDNLLYGSAQYCHFLFFSLVSSYPQGGSCCL